MRHSLVLSKAIFLSIRKSRPLLEKLQALQPCLERSRGREVQGLRGGRPALGRNDLDDAKVLTGTADTLDKLYGVRKLGGIRAGEGGREGGKEGGRVRYCSFLGGVADVG